MQARIRVADLVENTILRTKLGETDIVLIRTGSAVRAFGASCPHAGAPLEHGAICNGRLICPWHKATFRIEDGALLEPPALDGLTRYPVHVEGDEITICSDPFAPHAPAAARHARIAAIIGSGAAGAAAAVALRHHGFDGRVLLIGEEAQQPYDRTTLSKFVVAGDMPPADVPPLRKGNDWDALGVEQLDATVTRVDAAARRIELADGRPIIYDTALLATGGVARRPTIPGADLSGVHTLRNLLDAAAILAEARPGAETVIMGGSFIGLEVASALRQRGVGITVVAPEAVPFARQFGNEIGAGFRRLHEANGVAFHLGTTVVALEGRERVREVVLENGGRLHADSVIIGIGVVPATGFVEAVEKGDDGGIVVDSSMRAAGTLFVAGDCALFPLNDRPRHDRLVRIEHWRVAQQHARVAALGMMGREARYEGVPFFWTYHYGKRFEYLGHAGRWDELHIDGDLDAQTFIAFQVAAGRVVGVIACGREKATASLIEPMREALGLADARAVLGRA